MATDTDPADIPAYDDWLLTQGLDDSPFVRDSYARLYFSVDLPAVPLQPLDLSPTESPLAESPVDAPIDEPSTPAELQESVDDATAEALAHAESVLADLDDAVATVTTTESTPAVTVLSTIAGQVADATTAATAAAQEALDKLDQELAVTIAEATIQGTDLADSLLPPPIAGGSVPINGAGGAGPADPAIRTAPPGISQLAWDNETVTCQEFRDAAQTWLESNPGVVLGLTLGDGVDTPFGNVVLDYPGTDDHDQVEFPFIRSPSTAISAFATSDPSLYGKVAYPALSYPGWMDTKPCGGTDGPHTPNAANCIGWQDWLHYNFGWQVSDIPAWQVPALEHQYSEYLTACRGEATAGGRLQSGGSCDDPLYVVLCGQPAASPPPDRPPQPPAEGGGLPAPSPLPSEMDCAAAITLPAQGLIGATLETRLSAVLGITDVDGDLRPIPGASELPAIGRWTLQGVALIVAAIVNWWGFLGASVAGASLCKTLPYQTAQFSRMVLSIVNLAFFGAFAKTDRAFEQVMDVECPQEFPSPAEAHAAYLNGTITKEQWTCYQRLGNVRPAEAEAVLDAQRDRPGTLQVIDLWRRGLIDRDTLNTRLQQLGVLRQSERDEFVALSYFVPTVSDLIPWMVKDVFNPAVVQQFQLDDNFDQSYSQQAKDWAKANGISDEIMQAAWRAHWHLPSPTQLATFWHLFRHDGRHGTPAEFRQRIRDALRQADWLPTWIDDYIDSQYRPLTRVDARRAFEIGALNDKELWLAYTHAGYSDDNATVLVNFNKVAIARKFAGHWSAKAYQKGTLSAAEAETWLVRDGADPAAVTYALDTARGKRDADRRARCISAARRRYLAGETTEQELTDQLLMLTADAGVTSDLVAAAKCDRHNRSKTPATNQICTWLSNGSIDAAQAFDRLTRIGWDDDDAARILRDCQLRIGLSITKQQARQIKEAAAKVAAAKRERLKDLREIRDNRVRAARLADSKREWRERRTRTLLTAASQLALHLGTGVDQTFPVLDDYYRAATRNTIQLPDDILSALAAVAARDTAADLADYVGQVEAALAGLPAADVLPDAPEATTILAEPFPPVDV